MSDETAPPRPSAPTGRWKQPRHGHRLAFVLTLLLIVGVVVSLPFALESMRTQLLGEQVGDLYDLVSGQPVPLAAAAPAGSPSFVSLDGAARAR
jgi:hypothetical protein